MKMQDENYHPKLVEGIEITVLFDNKKEKIYSLGSKLYDRYIQLSEKNKDAIEVVASYMDGKKNISEISDILLSDYQTRIDVCTVCEWFCKAGLISNPPEDVKLEKQEMDYLSITIKKWKLDRFCGFFSLISEKCAKTILFISILLFIGGVVIVKDHWREFVYLKNYEISGSFVLGISWMILVFVLSIGLHELAHAVVGYHFGLKPKELVFALYVGSPMFYVKIPGIYTIAPKKRICVWIAGVYLNLMLASICLIIMTLANGIFRNLLMMGVTTNISLVLANLSPLLPLDGYFILSTLLQRPNLRKGSFYQFKKWAMRQDNSFGGLYIIYFLASVLFYISVFFIELKSLIHIIVYGATHNYGFKEYVYEFRLLLAILTIIILKKVVDIISRLFKNDKERKIIATS